MRFGITSSLLPRSCADPPQPGLAPKEAERFTDGLTAGDDDNVVRRYGADYAPSAGKNRSGTQSPSPWQSSNCANVV
jgi:hypothetical protein